MDKKRNLYKEIFNLVKKTGEKLVIINPDIDEAVVVMPIADYRALLLKDSGMSKVEKNMAIEPPDTDDLSFWQTPDWQTPEEGGQTLDKPADSGRIDKVKSKKSMDNITADYFDESNLAGEGYYFEPTD